MKVNALNTQKNRRLIYTLIYAFSQYLYPTGKYYNFSLKLGRRHKCGIDIGKKRITLLLFAKDMDGIMERWEYQLGTPYTKWENSVWGLLTKVLYRNQKPSFIQRIF